jgi:2-keto-4-pentenoate hydratase/2-oxohepta-3-ene-1,7-dioic acid hydratase in catechol pathway
VYAPVLLLQPGRIIAAVRDVSVLMKIVVFGPGRRVGALVGDRVVDLNRACARLLRERGDGNAIASADERVPADVQAFIAGGTAALEGAQNAIEHALGAAPSDGDAAITLAAADVKLHAPWPQKRIACAGGNYAAHSYGMAINRGTTGITLESQAQRIRSDGYWGFWKNLDEVAGPGTDVPYPKRATYFDYEGEVVIVIGKRGTDIPADRIAEYVWGVTLGNDWSIRDDEKGPVRPVSYNLPKNFDRSASLGPCIVVGELDPQNVDVETRVGGELRQSYNSSEMVFSFGELLEYLSRGFTFVPGDVIFGGTGAGTAQDSTKLGADGSRPLDRFLKPGLLVEVSSPRIGTLSNKVV